MLRGRPGGNPHVTATDTLQDSHITGQFIVWADSKQVETGIAIYTPACPSTRTEKNQPSHLWARHSAKTTPNTRLGLQSRIIISLAPPYGAYRGFPSPELKPIV